MQAPQQRRRFVAILGLVTVGGAAALWACTTTAPTRPPTPDKPEPGASTCGGAYPSYWQDPRFTSTGMWYGQTISDQPPAGWTGPVFQLSQRYPQQLPPLSGQEGWQKHDPFKAGLSEDEKRKAADDYSWSVMRYLQEGNILNGDVEKDWTLCNNAIRSWYHIPFQTYDPSSGREFMHGLTREAPVTFTLKGGSQIKTTVWAVALYNPRAAYTLGEVWRLDGTPTIPSGNMQFAEGAVVGKLLFTTATPTQIPILANLPRWQANISAPAFCNCKPTAPATQCSFQQLSEQCPRSPGVVTLLQFDIAVRDSRSPTGWAFGTFVADGQAKASEPNPWNRISSLGLMWGNDTPPAGGLAINSPPDPRKNGFPHAAIAWDVVDRWNAVSNGGHLGCNSRLNGPADNARSSCLSCHMTASVPDKNRNVPPIFNLSSNGQCAQPGNPAADAVYFANGKCSQSFQGGTVVAAPQYADGQKNWISTDFSLQLSISMVQWMEWQADLATEATGPRLMQGVLPGR